MLQILNFLELCLKSFWYPFASLRYPIISSVFSNITKLKKIQVNIVLLQCLFYSMSVYKVHHKVHHNTYDSHGTYTVDTGTHELTIQLSRQLNTLEISFTGAGNERFVNCFKNTFTAIQTWHCSPCGQIHGVGV